MVRAPKDNQERGSVSLTERNGCRRSLVEPLNVRCTASPDAEPAIICLHQSQTGHISALTIHEQWNKGDKLARDRSQGGALLSPAFIVLVKKPAMVYIRTSR